MSQIITCPHCSETYDLSEVLTKDIEKHLKEGIQKELRQKEALLREKEQEFEEKRKKQNDLFKKKLEDELEKKQKSLKKEAEEEQAGKLKAMQLKLEEEQAKHKTFQTMEVEKMELEKKLKAKDEEVELAMRKQALKIEEELKEKLGKEILLKEREKFDLEKRTLEKQLNDQKKIAGDMQKKLEQGSMQTQGEVMELAIEETLAHQFPYDEVVEVKKGQYGADCILRINNSQGKECGRIVLESKNAENYSKDWIVKLKSDAQKVQGDIAILVTRNMPKGHDVFDLINGVWVCRIHEMVSLIKSVRENIIELDRLKQGSENKGEKKEMLYDFFISNEFRQHIRSINEAYMSLKMGVQDEKNKMERIWKAREKQIDKVLLNNNHLIGSIEGITGEQLDDTKLLEE